MLGTIYRPISRDLQRFYCKFAIAAAFLLLVPELLADYVLLARGNSGAETPAHDSGDTAAALLPSEEQPLDDASSRQRNHNGNAHHYLRLGTRHAAAYGALVVCLAAVSIWQLSHVWQSYLP